MIDLNKLVPALEKLAARHQQLDEQHFEKASGYSGSVVAGLYSQEIDGLFEAIGYKPEARGDEGLNIPGKIKWMSKEELMKMFPDKPKRA